MFRVNDIVVITEDVFACVGDVGMIVGGPDMPAGVRYSASSAWSALWLVMFPDGEKLTFKETELDLVSRA